MGVALIPIGIVLGGVLSAVLVFSALWRPLSERLNALGKPFRREIEVADLAIKPEQLGYIAMAAALVIWLLAIALVRPGPLVGIVSLALVAAIVFTSAKVALRVAAFRTVQRFGEQLENVLRMFAGAVRVGLGVRQALIHVADQSPEPARRELTRVVGSTNLGIPIVDALDVLAGRMPLAETRMLAGVMRVQSQTGSDLAVVLEGLADTIRDRRRFARKVRAMTSQGRATAWLLGFLPLGIGLFVFTTQPHLRDVTFGTGIGRVGLTISLVLDVAATAALLVITRIAP